MILIGVDWCSLYYVETRVYL